MQWAKLSGGLSLGMWRVEILMSFRILLETELEYTLVLHMARMGYVLSIIQDFMES